MHILRSTPEKLYPVVEQALKLVQTLACMEILHAATGLVRASAVTTFIQVFSRIFVLWGITHVAPPAQTSFAFTLMCASWASVEVPRYTYLTANLWGAVPYPLLWLRYSLFAVLYPTGITGEMWSIVSALDFVRAHHVLSMALPNAYNLLFNYHGFLWFVLAVVYPFGGYYMYTHMVRQRGKKLSPPKAKIA